MTHRTLLSLVLILAGCSQSPPSCPQEAPSAAPKPNYDPEAIRPDPAVSRAKTQVELAEAEKLITTLKTTPRYDPSNYDHTPPPNVPPYLPANLRESCPKCTGFGGTVVAVTPSRKSAESHAMALRSIVAYYKGQEWIKHVTIVPWFDNRYALIFADTYSDPAAEMCAWLTRIGWWDEHFKYGTGIPGTRICQVYRTWYPVKP